MPPSIWEKTEQILKEVEEIEHRQKAMESQFALVLKKLDQILAEVQPPERVVLSLGKPFQQ